MSRQRLIRNGKQNMKRGKFFSQLLVWMAAFGLCVPNASAVETADRSPVVKDVVLHQGGSLEGYVVNPENATIGNVPVDLYGKDKHLATYTTDRQGRFMFTGLQTGVYEIAAADGRGVYRAWQENIAPPSADSSATVVSGSDVVRGQAPAGSLLIPLIISGLTATAIAVPIAVYNAQHKSPASGN
jgi:hypothetical protein